jgi:hypothetical protein
MIDGFGWFAEANYRRSWLFFDDVDYIFAARSIWPGYPPAWAGSSRDFALTRPVLATAMLEGLVDRVRSALDERGLRTLVAARVPEKDARYAVDAVSLDEDLRPVRERAGVRLDPAFALGFLAAKLLATARASGAVPLFGRPYAADILASVAGGEASREEPGAASLLTPQGNARVVTIATDLSCSFVSDDQLLHVPFERLVDFKSKHRRLLEREQLHLVEIAQEVEALPDGEEFDARLRRVRLDALKRKHELHTEAREAWLGFGFDLAAKTLASGGVAAAFESAVAVIRGAAAGNLAHAAAVGAVAGAGVVAASALHTAWDLFRKRGGSLAYLFEAETALGK